MHYELAIDFVAPPRGGATGEAGGVQHAAGQPSQAVVVHCDNYNYQTLLQAATVFVQSTELAQDISHFHVEFEHPTTHGRVPVQSEGDAVEFVEAFARAGHLPTLRVVPTISGNVEECTSLPVISGASQHVPGDSHDEAVSTQYSSVSDGTMRTATTTTTTNFAASTNYSSVVTGTPVDASHPACAMVGGEETAGVLRSESGVVAQSSYCVQHAAPAAASVPKETTATGHQATAATKRGKQFSMSHSIAWKKLELIGEGTDGRVYKAVDLTTFNYIAVKEVRLTSNASEGTDGPEYVRRKAMLKWQTELLESLPPHSNVVSYKGTEWTSTSLRILMEFVPGGSVSTLLTKLGAFGEKVVRRYARHICQALVHLHAHNIIHRDIKGANCLVGTDGTAKLADFGSCLSSIASPAGGENKGLHGTSLWMSPECIRSVDVNEKTDIWSLGCTIIEMASGKAPWHEARFTNEWAAMFYISQADRGPPIPPMLSRHGHRFLQRCFCVNPTERPSAEECLQDPFLSMDYDEHSSDTEMHPPHPHELSPPHHFPTNNKSGTITDAETLHSFSTIGSSNMGAFAVIDPEWGDELDVVKVGPGQSGAPNDDEEEVEGEGRVGGGGAEPVPRPPAFPPLGGATVSNNQQRYTPEDQRPSSAHVLSARSLSQVSQEAIETWLRQETASALDGEGVRVLAGSCGELDTLGDPIAEKILEFCDARSLGVLTQTNKHMAKLCDDEQLWKNIFVAVFLPVHPVRNVLRKGWKAYYRGSISYRSVMLNNRYVFHRRMCHSDVVFEGVDVTTDTPVAIKVEPWVMRRAASRQSPTTRKPARSPPKSREGLKSSQGSGSPQQVPLAERSPQKPVSRHGLSSATLSPLQMTGTQSSTSGTQQWPTPVTGGKMPPPPVSIGTGTVGPARGRLLPRHKGLLRTSVTPLSTALLTSVRGSTPGAPPPSQQGRVGHQSQHTSIGGPGGGIYDGTISSQMTQASPSVSASHSGTLRGSLTGGGTPLSGLPSWNDLYEYQRTETPSKTVRERSILQHQHKILRHLEAMGVSSICRPLYFTDSEMSNMNALVTTQHGPNLNDLLLFCGNQFSHRTVAQLAIRLLTVLDEIHDRDVVHGGITPSNVVIGHGSNLTDLILINFSAARFYRDTKTHRPITSQPAAQRVKSQEQQVFSSTFVQRGCNPYPRDDIISLGYVLCYLVHGGLPWINQKQLDSRQLEQAKKDYLNGLSRQPPVQLYHFLRAGYNLKQGERPDTQYLINILHKLMSDHGWDLANAYDWVSRCMEITASAPTA